MKERVGLYKEMGSLFDENDEFTTRLDQLLRGLTMHILRLDL